jgi:pyruvate dehydrogenase E1 component
VNADVWSVTSYSELRRDGLEVERWNRLHPSEAPRVPYVAQQLQNTQGPIIASSDYMKTLPDTIAPWLQGRMNSLGTDGFGRSENREHLRKFFEISAEAMVQATLAALARWGNFDSQRAQAAVAEMGMDAEKKNPARL